MAMVGRTALRLDGAKEIRDVLATFEDKMQVQVWRRALLAGARVVRDRARAAAPVRQGDARATRPKRIKGGKMRLPGHLRANVIAKVLRRRRNGQIVVIAGTRGEAWYGRLVETGWNPIDRKARRRVLRNATGRRRLTASARASDAYRLTSAELGSSTVPPKPWLRPAFQASAQQAVDAVRQELWAGIRRAIKVVR